jgi:hypothetical protein
MPRTLPNDYARCMTQDCPLSASCLRKQRGNAVYQSMAHFPGGKDCWGHIKEDDQ